MGWRRGAKGGQKQKPWRDEKALLGRRLPKVTPVLHERMRKRYLHYCRIVEVAVDSLAARWSDARDRPDLNPR